MGYIAEWSYTTPIEVKLLTGTDEWGGATYSAPFTIMGSYTAGGDLTRDDNGDEFISAATVFTSDDRVRFRALLRAHGSDWQEVRSVMMYDNSAVGDTPDYRVVV